jgi:hypothetical protein
VENRIEKRISHYIDLMYGSNDTFCPGIADNLSFHGMLIHAESQMVPINHEIKLMLTLGDNLVSMRGVVCWNSEILSFQPEAERYIGIFISNPHPGYVDYVSRLN